MAMTLNDVIAEIDEILDEPETIPESLTNDPFTPGMDVDSNQNSVHNSPQLLPQKTNYTISESDLSDSEQSKIEFSLKNKGKLFSLPASKVDLSKRPGIESSRWNTMNKLNSLKKPEVSKTINFSSDFSEFSSDPITTDSFKITKPKDVLSPLEASRKRASMATPTTEYSHSKAIRLNGKAGPTITTQKEHTTPKEALLDCRDLLMKAYSSTKNRKTQTELLDLLDIFRHYTEKGRIQLPITFASSTNDVERITGTPPIPEQMIISGKNVSNTAATAAIPKSITTPPSKSLWTTIVGNSKAKNNRKTQTIAPQTKKITQTTISKSKTPQQQQANSQNTDKIITIVINEGFAPPKYNALTIRDDINTILGKKAIARVHTSPRNNVVLTCLEASADDLLASKNQWESIFSDWPITAIQKVHSWPKLVIHGVSTKIQIYRLKNEAEEYNKAIQIQGDPRWLTGTPKKSHASAVISVATEKQKTELLKSGILIGGQLLKVVKYQSQTEKTQCRNCLKFGHYSTLCRRKPVCAYCLEGHSTSDHSCAPCLKTGCCSEHPTKCYNCNSNKHNALQKDKCDYYKALSC